MNDQVAAFFVFVAGMNLTGALAAFTLGRRQLLAICLAATAVCLAIALARGAQP